MIVCTITMLVKINGDTHGYNNYIYINFVYIT